MLSLQSTRTFPLCLQRFCCRYQEQLSTFLQQHQRVQLLPHFSCASGTWIRHQELWTVLDHYWDQQVEDFETMETQYLVNVHKWCCFHASFFDASSSERSSSSPCIHLSLITSWFSVRICLAAQKMFSLLSLTLANFSFSAFLLAV